MEAIGSLLSPFGLGGSAVTDTLKLVVVGGGIETARRASMSVWNGFVDSFFLTAHFSDSDYPYDWLMHWLAKQPAWSRSREFEITSRRSNRRGISLSATNDIDDDEEDTGLNHGKGKRVVAFQPTMDTTHTIFYHGHWLRVTRSTGTWGDEALKISVVARNNDIFKRLVLEAKRDYEKEAENHVHIFMADSVNGYWAFGGSRQKRPMSSIVLQPGVKDMLLDDCKDFMNSQDWYAERGIPFRRGYLLYGVPGSGKTSLIHSLAGELGLDIYVLSLSAKGMSDDQLGKLMNQLPSKSVVLLEDLDAAFTRATNRDDKSTGSPDPKNLVETKAAEADGSTLTLSGLLNAMDGVAAAEGRLLFATTNHLDRLDAALSRPGRLDVWVGFANATQWQAEGIFKCFFPIAKKVAPVASTSTGPEHASQKNVPGMKRKKMGMAICPPLEEEELLALAKKFAAAIPEDELSVASLQGYLLKNKSRPRECVDEVAAWVISERETREKLSREKAEREAKAALELKEAEEKAKKEKEATEAKEKAEKEATLAAEKKEARNKLKAYIKSEAAKKEGESAKVAEASDSSAGSSTLGDSSTGAEADTESITSEEDATPTSVDAQIKEAKSEKWVSVPAAATPEPATATAAS